MPLKGLLIPDGDKVRAITYLTLVNCHEQMVGGGSIKVSGEQYPAELFELRFFLSFVLQVDLHLEAVLEDQAQVLHVGD